MTVALVLGDADCLMADIEAYGGPVDGVVACNHSAEVWPGELDAWVTGHPQFFVREDWPARRAANGYPPAREWFCHAENEKEPPADGFTVTTMHFPGQPKPYVGSSGLFAAKVALIDLGFDRAVLCGIPMTPTPHFYKRELFQARLCRRWRQRWLTVPEAYRARMRSMSGWTREILGAPE